jgi:uncharacterized membrane protein (DUF485 family)
MTSELNQRIYNHPRYQELVRGRSRLAWTLSAITLGSFFALILVGVVRPDLLAVSVSDSGVVTIAVLVGVIMLALFWLLTGVYLQRTTRVYDKINEQILRDVQLRNTPRSSL